MNQSKSSHPSTLTGDQIYDFHDINVEDDDTSDIEESISMDSLYKGSNIKIDKYTLQYTLQVHVINKRSNQQNL